MLSEIIPPISAMMQTMSVNRKSLTKQGLADAPPTHPIRPEKKRPKPRPITT
jgi:hypothetical protein